MAAGTSRGDPRSRGRDGVITCGAVKEASVRLTDKCGKEATSRLVFLDAYLETRSGCPRCGNPDHRVSYFDPSRKVLVQTPVCDEHAEKLRLLGYDVVMGAA